jgi:hypothetical protein
MGEDIALIWPSVKAKYFLFLGLTQFTKTGSDLPVGLVREIIGQIEPKS